MDEALRIARELNDRRIEARGLLLDGMLSHDRGNITVGRAQQQRAIEMAKETGDTALEAMILTGMGLCHWNRADYVEALRYHQEARALETETGDLRGEAVTRRHIGQVYFMQGLYERALLLAERVGDLTLQSRILESMGGLHRDKHRNAQAIDCYLRALRNYEALNDLRGQGASDINIGLSYCFQGAYQEALAHFRREEAWALAGIGLVHLRNGGPAQALPYHLRAEKIWEEIGDRRALTDDIRITGDVYLELGDYPSAMKCYLRARDLGEKIRLPYLSSTLGNLGRVYALLGDAQRALACGQQAIEDSRRTGNEGMRWVADYRMGVIQRQLGLREQALLSLRESLAAIEDLRAGVTPDDEAKSGCPEDKQIVYAETVDLLIELGRVQEAMELAERARARAFLDLLRARELVIPPQDALTAVASGRRPSQTQPAAVAGAAIDEISMRGPEIVRTEIGKLRTQGLDLASIAEATPLFFADLREEARLRRTTVVEYFVTEHKLFIRVLEPGGDLHVASAVIASRELEALVRMMRGVMLAPAGAWEVKEDGKGEERESD